MNEAFTDTNHEDMTALTDVLQHIKGSSPVAGNALELGFAEDEAEV